MLLLLLATACEDPSNVGIGLIGEQGGTPTTVVVAPRVVAPSPVRDVTGGSTRVLAGRVQDPALGTLAATGLIDFASPGGIPNSFRNGTVGSAELRLRRDYVYGDTTATVQLRLRSLPAAWTASGARADTTVALGPVITEFSFTATDTLIVVPLPATWVTANDTTLRSTTFNAGFHGFALEGASETAVAGFNAQRVILRAVAAQDTVNFSAQTGSTLTTVTRTGTVDLPPGQLLLQDGAGPGILFDFDFTEAGLASNAVNRVVIRFHADTLALAGNTPPNFHRPLLRTVRLQGLAADSTTFNLGDYTLDNEGRLTLLRSELTGVVQRILLGGGTIERFRLAPPENSNTLNPLVLYDLRAAERAPEAVFTVIPVLD